MGRRRRQVALAGLLTLCAALLAPAFGGADSEVKVKNLILRADGGFYPQALPPNAYAPIDFKAHANLINTEGGAPTPLDELKLDFDRDGKIETDGLPVCPVAKIVRANVGQARSRCADSVVGTGNVGAILFFEGVPVEVKVKATFFNGPKKPGFAAMLVGHAYSDIPSPRTYIAKVPIREREGAYRYRAFFDIPKIATGGILTHIDGRIGLRYRAGGEERSYASARCTKGVIKTHGNFTFTDGVIIDGSIEKPCFPIGKYDRRP